MTNCALHKNCRPFLNNIIKIGFVVNPIDIVNFYLSFICSQSPII